MSPIDAIKGALQQWVAAINARRSDAIVRLVSDDVVFIHPPAVPFIGKAAVARVYRLAFSVYNIHESLQYEDIRVIGTLAIARVAEHVQLRPRSGGDPTSFVETEAIRFRRHTDGTWKLVSRSLTAPGSPLSPFVTFAPNVRLPLVCKPSPAAVPQPSFAAAGALSLDDFAAAVSSPSVLASRLSQA